ncbi:MAG: LysR family transcriptional regulator, partial [Pseudonocardia sediminis]
MASIDLNLLTVLDALLQEGSVSGAARRLHLTAPGVSRSLAKLREITGDPLLVRAGRNLVPTPLAESLRDRAHEVLADVHEVLSPAERPSDEEIERTLETTFTVRAGPDNAEGFGPALLRLVLERAPRVRLRLVEAGDGAVEALRDGRIDLNVGSPVPTGEETVYRDTLLTDRFVVVGRVDGALARRCGDRDPDPEDLAEVRHVSSSRQGLLRGPLDDRLAEHGLQRAVVASARGFAATFALARQVDLVCTAPERLTRAGLG